MEDVLSFDFIQGEEEIDSLFDPTPDKSSESPENEEESEEQADKKEKKNTTEVDTETLFEEEPESVGSSKEDNEGKKEDADSKKDGSTSPNDFYSSIANALAEDGVFPNLSEETINGANDAESFSGLIEAEIEARLDEKQKRIAKALDNNVEASDIRKYENTLDYIKSIEDNPSVLVEESEKGEQLRRNLIYQDFLNKGMTPEKAQKLTERTINSGNDIEDAKEALISNKEFFRNAYNNLLQDAQNKANAEKETRIKQAKAIESSLLKDKQLIGDIELSTDLRKKALKAITQPVYRDSETGQYMTELQKYQSEHPEEFIKYSGLFYTMTNGFKDFKSFTKGQVKKEVRKGMKELEQKLNGTRRASDGSLKMVSNAKDDPESYFSNLTLDI